MELIRAGQQYLGTRQWEEAEQCFRAALEQDVLSPQAMHLLGLTVFQCGRQEEGITLMDRSLANAPQVGIFYANLGEAYRRIGRVAEAKKNLVRAVELTPENAEAWHNLGLVLIEDLDYPGAITLYEKAIALRPDYANAHWSLAVALLTVGDFARGWGEYEWRWRNPQFPSRRPQRAQPQWNGEDLAGKTILVQAEQGFGDTIQFARFVPELVRRGAQVILEVQPELVELLTPLAKGAGGIMVVAGGCPLPPFDVHIPLLSLMGVLGVTVQGIPGNTPYVTAERVEEWAGKVTAPAGTLKVGLAWAGRPEHINDRNRSCPPGALARLDEVASVVFYSLQVGRGASEVPLEMKDRTGELTDFAATAGLIANLDLVISVDTAVAHLAGALGKPTWVMLPYAGDWRWFLGQTESPWYPSMRLFRQPARGDWESVMGEVVGEMIGVIRRGGRLRG